MGKIFVHIGLPKTATSTLQADVFPAVQDEKLIYLGVDGDRQEGASSSIYYQFMNAIESGHGIEDVKTAIRAALQNGDLLLSEEMLTVSSATVWQEKLDRVAQILTGLDYRIIVSVREPVSALFSYYVELYPRFSKMRFVECAMCHNDMFIYHYSKLLNKLGQIFEIKNLFFIQFEDISQNNINPLINFLTEGRQLTRISYGIHNTRVKDGTTVVSPHQVTPYTLMMAVYRKLGLGRFGFLQKLARFSKNHTKILDKLVFKKIIINRPSAAEIAYLKHELIKERTALSSQFGISYE